jgi:LPXTG-site transpeptidase (sortase) family protein
VYPGETGNSYVSAHSSALPWVQSPYKTIFARFGELKEGDVFNIILTLDSGKTVKLDYVVRQKGIYDADDQAQFVNTAKSTVSLSTCWPIGTAKQRYVVRGELVKFEQNP